MKQFAVKLVRKISDGLQRHGWVKASRRVRALFLSEKDNKLDFFINALFKLPNGLRKQLHVDEDSFTQISGIAHADNRAYYFYGVCDEALQAATASLRWRELAEGPPLTRPTDVVHRGIARAVLDSVADEQNLWKRKLTEHLVNTISFSQYNTQPYFKAFLAAEELDRHLGIERDLRDFYACNNRNNRYSIDRYAEIISDIQRSEGISKLPFLLKPINPKSLPRPGGVFLTLRERFKCALAWATDDERLVLRFSYGHGFSSDSKSMHALVTGEPREWSDESIESGLMQVGLISTSLVLRAHTLTSLPLEGLSDQIARVLRGGTNASRLVGAAGRALKTGDIVLAHGDLAEVVGMSTSSFGYTSFKVQYLTRAPISSIPEDEWPARYIRLLIAKERVRGFLEKGLSQTTEGAPIWDSLKNLSDDQFHEALKTMFVDLDKRGLLRLMFQQPKEHRGRRFTL